VKAIDELDIQNTLYIANSDTFSRLAITEIVLNQMNE